MPSDANPSAPHTPWIADRLDVRVAQGRVESAQLAGLVEALAALHAAAGCTPVPASSLAERGALARASVAELAPSLGAAAGACERALEAAVEASGAALAARRDAPRRLHGRLACEEIHVDPAGRAELGAPARSAAGDPCEDVAALALELAARGRADLALRLVGGYAGRTGDFSLYRVLDAYLALAGLLASQRVLAAAAARAEPARAAAARLLAAPAELAAPAREPFVIAVAGGIASGKSTLAARISASCGAPVASADAARAGGLAGLEPEAQQAAYAEMRRRAAEVLASGRPVVVDACFARRVQRDALRSLAGERGARFLFVECRADAALTRRRLEERARGQGRPARDWLALRERLLASWEPLRELPREQHLVVDTSRDPSLCLPRIERALGRGAPGPHRVRHDFPKRAILHA